MSTSPSGSREGSLWYNIVLAKTFQGVLPGQLPEEFVDTAKAMRS